MAHVLKISVALSTINWISWWHVSTLITTLPRDAWSQILIAENMLDRWLCLPKKCLTRLCIFLIIGQLPTGKVETNSSDWITLRFLSLSPKTVKSTDESTYGSLINTPFKMSMVPTQMKKECHSNQMIKYYLIISWQNSVTSKIQSSTKQKDTTIRYFLHPWHITMRIMLPQFNQSLPHSFTLHTNEGPI